MVISYAPDLMLRSKIDIAARHYGVETLHVATPAAFAAALDAHPHVELVLLDLDLPDVDMVALVRMARERAAGARVVGACSHVMVDLIRDAREAGAHSVVANSTFVAGIPGYFAPLAGNPSAE